MSAGNRLSEGNVPGDQINRRFITFEGADGCGKSTQIALAADFLREKGETVFVTREPGGCDIGREIRRLLLAPDATPTPACELLLFLADRAQHVSEYILPKLEQGAWVLCDRYSDSTVVYQLAARKVGSDREIAPLLAFAEQGLSPALTLWLDLPLDEALQRLAVRTASAHENRIDRESTSFHQSVHHGFAERHRKDPARIRRIDATGSVSEVQQRIQLSLEEYLQRQASS